MILESGELNDNISDVKYIRLYKESTQISEFTIAKTKESTNTDLLSYDIIVPRTLDDLRYLKSEIDYFTDTSGIYTIGLKTYIKLFVPKGISKVVLFDSSNTVIATFIPENRFNFKNEIYKNYSFDEINYDKVVILTNDDEFDGVKFHESNLDHHKEHVIFSYYDQDYYNFIAKVIINQITKTQNMNVNSGVLITDDFSKLFLGTLYVEDIRHA